jgi:hypothetical protein
VTTDPLYHPLLSDRLDFICAMNELVQTRARMEAKVQSSYLNRSSFSERTIARFNSNASNAPCSL